ncbi:hypothetical protein I302_103886 [Kwoniella bestiolae CBS 10118]|uniref:GTPase-activating protein GYP5 n=1 Tax=Kwoniella bestiolae CBS 10118 TaxID=1296100 RepID=A0A1B9G9Q3_9TREE|nr:hypothetical protein I302_02592 [Kwoniella bestiolae CBS 10118]OCF27746.1 hypothetical protein I302_02592 [Kwoniella bestiolae CBS 10118]
MSSPSLSIHNTPSSTSSSRLSPQLNPAEGYELDDHSSLTEDVLTPSASSFNTSPSPSRSDDNDTTPVKSKSKSNLTVKVKGSSSKVKAAAAMFENKSPSSSSFRSIPVNTSPIKKLSPSRSPSSRTPSPSKSPSPSPSNKNVLKSPDLKLNSPFINRAVSPSPSPPSITTPSPSSMNIEKFQEVSLSSDTPQFLPQETATTPTSLTRQRSNQPPPVPVNISNSLPEPITTPPAKEPSSNNPHKTSFFGSSLNFGFPSTSSSSTTTEPEASSSSTIPASQQPSRSGSTSSQGGWKSTMTSFLSSKPPPHEDKPPARPTVLERNPSEGTSSAFLLNRVDSSTASRDRRISAQLGGGQAIREGFERVKNEMESAAREMRRERESRALTESEHEDTTQEEGGGGGEEMVDWNFWGSVVQDFEVVARERPKELSKAIQMGIPPVIRGAIWQLMSSSKSTPLEETYKALLKIPSTHEKAIKKDLNRTFPNHKYFQDNAGIGQEGLFMVVKAYSLYDPEVGYTQGLAFIVAALLLNMPDEEAFCVLVRLMDSYNLRSHYTAEMRGLQLRLFQFDRLVEEILPLLHTHFVRQGVKSSIYAAQWFMTLFSYRFPLSLVYRVLDIVFAEGIEAIFRFSLALLKKSEDKLLELEFEQILNFLQSDLFEVYRVGGSGSPTAGNGDLHSEEEWKANEFVRDAYEIRITPFMLDSYASEWDEQQKNQNRHAVEIDTLRNANRNLSAQVKQLESSLATMNQEHVELVRQLVMSKIEKEETENELVRYKMLYAELAHAQQDAMSTHSRLSGGSIQSQNTSTRPSS